MYQIITIIKYGMIFKLPEILTVVLNSVDEYDSLYTCLLHNCLHFIPLSTLNPYKKILIFFIKRVGYNVGVYVGGHLYIHK